MGNCIRRSRYTQSEQPQPYAVKTQRLKVEAAAKWRSEVPMTIGQLTSKRDEFWDTASAYDGRKEIWDALRAATNAYESGDNDLAQAIIDGANVYIPQGSLSEAYDELGNRYHVPFYCLSKPTNLCEGESSPALPPSPNLSDDGFSVTLRLRLTAAGRETTLRVRPSDSVAMAKARLALTTPGGQRWFYGGRLLPDGTRISDLAIPPGHVIQVVYPNPLE